MLAAGNSKGFTLLELLIVLIIFILITTLSTPLFYKFFPSFQVKTFAKEFIADINIARTQAMYEGKPSVIKLSPEHHQYDINGEVTVIPPHVTINIKSKSNNNHILYPDGYSSINSVVIKSPELLITIEPNWLTGVFHEKS